jgi:glycosyltransferase involved in cell wall biosynthesis
LKLLIAHNDYGRPSGEEHALETLARLATRRGYEVVWLRRSSTEIDSSLGGKAKAFFAGVTNPWMAKRMAAELDAKRPDVVLVQNLYPLLSPSILAPCRERGIPVVMRCPNYRLFCPSGLHLSHGAVCERCLGGHEYWCVLRNCERDRIKSLGYALRAWSARVSRRVLNGVDLFVVLSEFQKRRFIAGGIAANRLEILPNVVPQMNGLDLSVDAQLITFVGRASPEKGIEDFVEAARRLPDLPFVVAGATERMPWLIEQSPPNLRWLGFLNAPDLNHIILQSRIVVLSTRCFEGFPNVITHAMVARKPVIASRIGAVPEIVTDGATGLLFETGNINDLVSKIRTLYPDASRCSAMGEAGRAKALAQYSEDVVSDKLIEILNKAIAMKGTGARNSPQAAIPQSAV